MGQVRKANDILTLSLHRDSNKIITNVAVLLPFLFTPCAVLPRFYFAALKVHVPQVSQVLIVMAVWGSV